MSGRREIVFDAEMTGIFVREGHRMAEVAAVEIIDGAPTGRVFHSYINPERPMPPGATAVNGLTDEFLADKPVFAAVARALRDFIGDSLIIFHCVIHQDYVADRDFMAMEMAHAGLPPFPPEQWINTKPWAKQVLTTSKNASLNEVLDHYNIPRTGRADHSGHGALLDAQLLAEAYPKIRADCQALASAQKPPAPPAPSP